MKQIVYYFILLFFWSFSIASLSQSKIHSNRPPWVIGKASSWQVGELPQVELKGNSLKVKFGIGQTRENAQQKAISDFVKDVISASGSTITEEKKMADISESQKFVKKKVSGHRERYESDIKANGKAIARYAIIDEYYEYNDGEWHYAGLFLLAANDVSLANLPPIIYGVDNGAWRSVILPGWAQLYQRRTMQGIGFMAVEAGLIGSAVYFNNLADYYKKRQNEEYNINIKQDYKKRYDQMKMFSNVAWGVSVAWYLYNVVDAFTSQRGQLYYRLAYRQTQFSFSPTVLPTQQGATAGLAIGIRF